LQHFLRAFFFFRCCCLDSGRFLLTRVGGPGFLVFFLENLGYVDLCFSHFPPIVLDLFFLKKVFFVRWGLFPFFPLGVPLTLIFRDWGGGGGKPLLLCCSAGGGGGFLLLVFFGWGFYRSLGLLSLPGLFFLQGLSKFCFFFALGIFLLRDPPAPQSCFLTRGKKKFPNLHKGNQHNTQGGTTPIFPFIFPPPPRFLQKKPNFPPQPPTVQGPVVDLLLVPRGGGGTKFFLPPFQNTLFFPLSFSFFGD